MGRLGCFLCLRLRWWEKERKTDMSKKGRGKKPGLFHSVFDAIHSFVLYVDILHVDCCSSGCSTV